MWTNKRCDFGECSYDDVTAWLNEIGAAEAHFVMRSPGIMLVFARLPGPAQTPYIKAAKAPAIKPVAKRKVKGK